MFNNQRVRNLFGIGLPVVLHKDEQSVGMVFVILHPFQMVAADTASGRAPEVVVIDNNELAHGSFSFMR